MNILVTVIIPMYNAEKYICNCLDSVIKQLYKEIEIIIVNDGSTDNSASIVREFMLNDNRIKIIEKRNEGLVQARIDGIKISCGDYIFFIDSDDTVEEYAISKLVEKINESNADIIIGDIAILNNNGKDINILKNVKDPTLSYFDSLLLKRIIPSLCGRLIKRDLIKDVIIPKSFTIGEDVITNLEIAYKFNPKIAIVNETIYNYYQHEGSMINTINYKNATKRLDYIKYVIDKYNIININDVKRNRYCCGAIFLVDEFYSYLRDGGDLEIDNEFKKVVYDYVLNNTFVLHEIPYWKIAFVRTFRFNKFLAILLRKMLFYIRFLMK